MSKKKNKKVQQVTKVQKEQKRTLLSMMNNTGTTKDQPQDKSKHKQRKENRYPQNQKAKKNTQALALRMNDEQKAEEFIKTMMAYQNAELQVNSAERFDLDKFEKMLTDVTNIVKAGKFNKLPKVLDKEMIAKYVGIYLNDQENTAMDDNIRKIIVLGKSVYEYGPENYEILPNVSYDGILAKYLSHDGNNEPVGIIPKGNKFLKKTGIKYPKLHNNMDKAYIMEAKDKVPDGVKETDSVESFLKRIYNELGMELTSELELELSPKLDGVSLNGTVHQDILKDPQTRGDRTESVAVIGLNNLQILADPEVEAEQDFGIQYEAFVTEENLIKASEHLNMATPYVSCRHAAAGIIHRLSTMEDKELADMLSLYPITTEGLPGTYLENMEYIQNFGKVPDELNLLIPREVIKGDYLALMLQIKTYYRKLGVVRPSLGFAIDGMVITLADEELQAKIGRNDRTNKYQIAMKFDPATAEGKVKGIFLDTGRKGFRTIQVELEKPVFLDGVRYDHIPVLSAELYDGLNLRKGSTVSVHRVGDVIPAITVIKEGNGEELTLPTRCPDCGTLLTRKAKKLYCANVDCVGNVVGRFAGFFERIGLDNYNDAFAKELYDDANCRNLADVISLTTEDMKKYTSNANSVSFPVNLAIQLATMRDYEILAAMGLPGVGPAKAKTILKECEFRKLADLDFNEARRIAAKAVGPDQANGLSMFMLSDLFKVDARAFAARMDSKQVTKNFESIPKVGHTGGNLSKATLQKIKDIGYEVTDGRSFDILIVGDMATNSKKAQIARAKGIPMMLEVDFLQQMDLPWKTKALEGVTQSAKMAVAVRPTEIVDVQDAVMVEEPKAGPKKEKPPVKNKDDGQWRGKCNTSNQTKTTPGEETLNQILKKDPASPATKPTVNQTKTTSGPRKNKESFYERITPKDPGKYIPWFHGAFAWTSVL